MKHLSVCYITKRRYDNLNVIKGYAQLLSRSGLSVSIVCHKKEQSDLINYKGVKIYPLFSSITNLILIDHIFDAIKLFKKLIINIKNFNILHFFNPTLLPLVGFIFKFFKKELKIVLDIRSIPVNPSSLWATLFGRLLYKLCDKISNGTVIISDSLEEYLVNNLKLGLENFEIIPDGTNLKKFKPINSINLRKKLNLESKFIFGYTGSLAMIRRIDVLVKAFEKLTKKHKNIVLLLVGHGNGFPSLNELVNRLNLKNKVIFTGYINYENIPEYINMFDIGLNYLPAISEYGIQPPTKLFEYLACGIPSISTSTLANKKLIKNRVNGLLCGFSIFDVYSGMKELLINADLRKEISLNARNSIKEFDWIKIINKRLIPFYLRLFKNIKKKNIN